jgi:hypothetical protein
MRHDEDGPDPHQGRKADRWAAIIREAPEGDQAAVQRQVGGTSEQFRDRNGEMIEHRAAGRGGSHFLAASNELGSGRRDPSANRPVISRRCGMTPLGLLHGVH